MPCCFDSLSPRRESSMSGAIHRAHRATLPKSRVRESRTSGSVRGAPGDRRLYSPKSTGQTGAARDLEGRDPGEGRARLRPVARALPQQVSQGHRLPGPRPRRTARVLRLPCRAPDAPSNHQRHRIGLRHDPSPKLASQGLRHPKDRALDDLQDGSVCGEILGRLRGFRQLAKVVEGAKFNDGIEVIEVIEDRRAAA